VTLLEDLRQLQRQVRRVLAAAEAEALPRPFYIGASLRIDGLILLEEGLAARIALLEAGTPS